MKVSDFRSTIGLTAVKVGIRTYMYITSILCGESDVYLA